LIREGEEQLMIKLKRIYDQHDKADGKRVLVDRLWPRGMKKEEGCKRSCILKED
jgi:uncharacterized protein YeaO (DUF488 family)